MEFDMTTGILLGAGVLLGILYFARRSARQKKSNRKL